MSALCSHVNVDHKVKEAVLETKIFGTFQVVWKCYLRVDFYNETSVKFRCLLNASSSSKLTSGLTLAASSYSTLTSCPMLASSSAATLTSASSSDVHTLLQELLDERSPSKKICNTQ
jgi:hypothetical protein